METIFAKLAENGNTGVAIAMVVAFVYVFRMWLKEQRATSRDHRQAYDKLSKSIDLNTTAIKANAKVTNETYTFLRNLNGSFKKVVHDKIEK